MKAKVQCVSEPSDWPRARTRLGKISEMNTQMTDPCPNAWEAMNPSSPIRTSHTAAEPVTAPAS